MVRVLIVEDESIIALDIQNSLTQAGFVIAGLATSAAEALENVVTLKPDVVLMDIYLRDGVDGVTAAEQIWSQFHLPIVYLTAHADDFTLQRAMQTQPFGYVTKPFDDRDLVTTIEIAVARHQAEAAIRHSLAKEREFSELKSRFVAVVSHEFRNPLNTILVASQLLEQHSDKISIDKKQLYLQRIQLSAKQMSHLLNEVLTLSEGDAGTLRFKPAPIDLGKFCREVVEEVELSHQCRHQIVFEATWQGANPDLGAAPTGQSTVQPCLDEHLLRHILTNLLANAIKYSSADSRIQFRVQGKSSDVIFQIQDQGIGIPAAEQAELFTSFFRASNAKPIPGTGLGLSIVKQCVDLHGGQIAFESQVGVGTTFTVTLPLSR